MLATHASLNDATPANDALRGIDHITSGSNLIPSTMQRHDSLHLTYGSTTTRDVVGSLGPARRRVKRSLFFHASMES